MLRDELGFEQCVDVSGVDYLTYGSDEWDTDVSSQGFSRGVEGRGPGRFKWGEAMTEQAAQPAGTELVQPVPGGSSYVLGPTAAGLAARAWSQLDVRSVLEGKRADSTSCGQAVGVTYANTPGHLIVFLADGGIGFDGTPEEFFASESERVRRYLNIFDAI